MAAVYQCGDPEGWFETKNTEGGKIKTTELGILRLKLDDAATFGLGTGQENIREAFGGTVEWVSSNGHSHGDQVTWWVF